MRFQIVPIAWLRFVPRKQSFDICVKLRVGCFSLHLALLGAIDCMIYYYVSYCSGTILKSLER